MAHDGVDRADARHESLVDELRARRVKGLGRQNEARVVRILRMVVVIVVVNPGSQALAEAIDEWLRDLVKAAAGRLRRERDVENDHATHQIFRSGEFAW